LHSRDCFQSVENDLAENRAGVVKALRGLIIAHGAKLCIELWEGETGIPELSRPVR
jgi:hypothetical protein